MKDLLFGTAGIPMSTSQPNTINGIRQVKALGLGAMELEFVHSVNITEKTALAVEEAAGAENIVLTCHAPYYINLNSNEKAKVDASIKRIFLAAKIASLCNCYSITFHAAFYQNKTKEETYKSVKENLNIISGKLKENNIRITLRPEFAGKISQFGNLQELIRLSQELENVLPCIDFAHLHARENGKYNTYEEFCSVLSEIEKSLGREALNNMHIHVSGINYSAKGERNHLTLKDSDLNYKDLIKAFKDFKINGVVISESPNIEQDALLLKKAFNSLA